jgi:cation diffusion facilitator CzcD-associated flavoprotein CzcO
MSCITLGTDYLVIGSGAMGMAFTDILMTETDARVVMVDRHHQPGGHWNQRLPIRASASTLCFLWGKFQKAR